MIGLEERKPISLIGNENRVTVDEVDSDEESERRFYDALTSSPDDLDQGSGELPPKFAFSLFPLINEALIFPFSGFLFFVIE